MLQGGYLTLHGRIKEMIIRGGENIAPAEIEQVLMSHPAVRDAVCFGVDDDKYGELVAAAVALDQDAQAKDLIDHCRQQPSPRSRCQSGSTSCPRYRARPRARCSAGGVAEAVARRRAAP